jgi:hypothetical protein
MSKSDQIEQAISGTLAEVSGDRPSQDPVTSRQAALLKQEIEGKTGGSVEIVPMDGGCRVTVSDPESGHRETFGVSRYGVTSASVRFGDRLRGGDRFIKILRSAVKKAQAMTPRIEKPKKPKAARPRAVATTPKSSLDLGRVPGTPTEQRQVARARREKPIRIDHVGPGDYRVIVLSVDIGSVPSIELARSAAHQVGRYRLDLGDFVETYVDGY